MSTMDEFLLLKEKHQSIKNNVLHIDKSNQYSNLNLNQNQNCQILIPVQYSNNPKNDKYCATFKSSDSSTVSDKCDKREKLEAWNKSTDLSSHFLTLNDKAEKEEAKKKWKKNSLSDVNSSTLSLHISAYENLKETTGFDTFDGENVELKKNKTNINKQLFPCLMIQNPFEFPRQQREYHRSEPEVARFRANQRFYGSDQRTSSNNARNQTAVASSRDANINRRYSRNRSFQRNLVPMESGSSMSDDIDVSIYRDEYIPYTSDAPRRSTRQRSVVQPYIPEKTPRMRVEKEPTKTRVGRNRTAGRSIPRDYEHYEADEVPQAPKFAELRANVINNAFAGGITRIPLISEVMKIGNDVIEMRWKEIHLIQDAIRMLKKKGIDENLIIKLETHLAALEWEMNSKNVMESDLPPMGPETTNFADISTWLVFYYELLHENQHRITDVTYSFTMLSKTEKKSLDKYEKMAEEVMKQFEENVRSFKLEGQSKNVYKTVTDEIRKNCKACL